ncbi:MAG: SMC family ATPase [Cyanobacteriota bacterium]
MIPARLKLENFMCFSDIEIDFSSLKTACLTGKNGSGKSSILDAITWVLWEQARSKSDKLIKLDMNNMKVELEFSVNNVKYKIFRFFQKGSLNNPKKGSKTLLELFYFDEKKNTWQPYSGKSLKETQDRINDIIKMEYDAFVNSVYIRQGNVDSFLTKSPEERKRVLADILGLGEYERLYRKSIDKAEQLKIAAKVLKEQINEGEIKQFCLKKHKNEKEEIITKINTTQEQLSLKLLQKEELGRTQNHYKILAEQKELYCNIKEKYIDDIDRIKANVDRLEGSYSKYKEFIALEEVIKNKYQNHINLKDKLKDFDNKELEYHKLKDRLIEFGSNQIVRRYGAEQEYKKICKSLEERLNELDRCRKILEESEKIQQKYVEYKDLKNKIENLGQFKLELADLETKEARLQTIINKLSSEYQIQIETIKSAIFEIEESLNSKQELIDNIDFLEKEIKQYDKYEAELERVREKGIAQREIIFDRGNKKAFIELELEKLKEKINLLQPKTVDPQCPTCSGKVINTEDIVRKLEFEIDNLMIQVESNENDISIAEDEMKFLRVAYKEKKKYLAKRSALVFELAEFKTELKNLEIEEKKLGKYKQDIIDLEELIKKQDFAQEEKYQINIINERKEQIKQFLNDYDMLVVKSRDLSYIEEAHELLKQAKEKAQEIETELPYFTMSKRTLEKELEGPLKDNQGEFARDAYEKLISIDYNLQAHIDLRQELNSSQEIEYDYLNLQYAYQQLPFVETNLGQFKQALENTIAELNRINEIINNIESELTKYSQKTLHLKEVDFEFEMLNNELNACNCDLAVVNERIRTVDEAMASIRDKRKDLDNINKDISHYIELANAFGEKGIQDIIIENSIPEIEKEANAFLAKLTDDQMRIQLKSSKRNKTFDVNERLDIYIADKLGTRSYELYSGGEAVRINFAIRIALSKLLAKSRGVKLQTLIIDDVFGSQDSAAQEKLASIINLIEDDFDMILIVTHNEALVELFQGRIEISKESGKPVVQVVA